MEKNIDLFLYGPLYIDMLADGRCRPGGVYNVVRALAPRLRVCILPHPHAEVVKFDHSLDQKWTELLSHHYKWPQDTAARWLHVAYLDDFSTSPLPSVKKLTAGFQLTSCDLNLIPGDIERRLDLVQRTVNEFDLVFMNEAQQKILDRHQIHLQSTSIVHADNYITISCPNETSSTMPFYPDSTIKNQIGAGDYYAGHVISHLIPTIKHKTEFDESLLSVICQKSIWETGITLKKNE